MPAEKSIWGSYGLDKAVDGVGSILAAIRGTLEGRITDEEVARAREVVLAERRQTMSTDEGAVESQSGCALTPAGPEWIRRLPQRIETLTRDDLVRVVKRYLSDDALRVLFVGDARWLDASPLRMGRPEVLELPQ